MQIYAGYIFIFIAATCWGFLGILGRIAMNEGPGPLDVAFWRALLGGLFMLLHAAYKKDLRIHSRNDFVVFCLFGIFSIASFFVAYQYAVRDGGAPLAAVLLYTAPAWVAVFSRIFFGLRFTTITLIAIAMALIGVMLISVSGIDTADVNEAGPALASQGISQGLPLMGIFFGLLSGFLYATHYIVTKKYMASYSPFTLYGYSSLVAALCILPFINLNFDLSAVAWFAIIGIAFISTYIAYWTYCEGIKRLNPTKAAVLATLEPVVATIAAWVIWGESFSGFGWLGAMLIVLTVLVLLLDDKKRASGP